jgi:putative nucleotidyltransferase with HDIG domain
MEILSEDLNRHGTNIARTGNGNPPKSRNIRVLLVDDEPFVARMLSRKLSEEGFECEDCSSGEAALAILAQHSYDAVISDLSMPKMSGFDLLKRIKANHAHLAFLMATGVDDVRVGIQAMKEGADDYLVKPFLLQAVIASLNRALQKKLLEKELEDYRKNLELMVRQRTEQLQAALNSVEGTYDETLEALGAALDLRDDETAGHSQRVTRYSQEISRVMGCSNEQLKQITRGACLHDIGKIGVPDSILRKPGKLTEDEWVIMRTHARIGFELVSRIGFLAPAAEIVLTHHERYDGSGYPQGLKETVIPLGARIFAVADALDAITSDRPYSRARSYDVARSEIIKGSGKQFDPNVVEAFRSIPQEVWRTLSGRTQEVELP